MNSTTYLHKLYENNKLDPLIDKLNLISSEGDKTYAPFVLNSEFNYGFIVVNFLTEKPNPRLVLNDYEIIDVTDINGKKIEPTVYQIREFYKYMEENFNDYDANFNKYMEEQEKLLNKHPEKNLKMITNKTDNEKEKQPSELVKHYLQQAKKEKNFQFHVMEHISEMINYVNQKSIKFKNDFASDVVDLAVGTSFPDFIHQYAMRIEGLTDESYVILTKGICENKFNYGDIKYHYCLDLPNLNPTCKRILTEAFLKDYHNGSCSGKIYIQYFYKYCKNLPNDCLKELKKYMPKNWPREV